MIMLKAALKILSIIEDNGFEAYIVGGFVRDYLLNVSSNDVDITTNATPKDLKTIFADACLSKNMYGSVTVIYKKVRFEITTYRSETTYCDNRRPSSIAYIQDLPTDLKRRDFTINTICMDKHKKIIDPLNGRVDLKQEIIRTIDEPIASFQQDVLRILRAIRFATTLHFSLAPEVEEAILQTKYLLSNLSFQRKKEELTKIFASSNVLYGKKLLQSLQLDEELSLMKLEQVVPCSQVIGIWTMLEVDNIYPFTRNERKQMEDIRACLKSHPLSLKTLYQYGLYPCTVAGEILGLDKKTIIKTYTNLPIHKRSDLAVTSEEILKYLQVQPGPFLNEIYCQLEELVLAKKITNKKKPLLKTCQLLYPMIIKKEENHESRNFK